MPLITMPYKVMFMSRTQWNGTELDSGDSGQEFATKEEAEAEKARLEADEEMQKDLFQAACEAQGLEHWLEVQEC